MKNRFLLTMLVAVAAGVGIGANASAGAAEPELVQLLTGKLGVTEPQASGGAGSIFNVAKQNMGKDDFSKVADAVPGIDRMMESAPKAGASSGMLGSASSLLGGSASSLTGVASLAGSFSQLGLKAGMVNAFTPIILNYVKDKGGEPLMNALQGALK